MAAADLPVVVFTWVSHVCVIPTVGPTLLGPTSLSKVGKWIAYCKCSLLEPISETKYYNYCKVHVITILTNQTLYQPLTYTPILLYI